MSLPHLLTRQAGVITLAQAVGCGMSAATVHRRAGDGVWVRLHPRVYLVGGHRLTDEARIWAAWLWAGGEPVAITGPAAAFWHGMLQRAPQTVELTVPRHTHLRPRPGVAARRRDLHWQDQIGVNGLWLADRPSAALETAVVLADGSTFLDRALQRHVRFRPSAGRTAATSAGTAPRQPAG